MLLFIVITCASSIIKIALRYGISIHTYADDTQLYIKLSTTDMEASKAKLIACFLYTQSWSASKRSKLNMGKTKLIWFDRRSSLHLDLNTLSLQLDYNCLTQPSIVARDLEVLLDSKHPMSNRIGSVIKACFFISDEYVKSNDALMSIAFMS